MFPCKIRGNFRASVPWCINTGISEISGKNLAENKAYFMGRYYLFGAELTLYDTSWLGHQFRGE